MQQAPGCGDSSLVSRGDLWRGWTQVVQPAVGGPRCQVAGGESWAPGRREYGRRAPSSREDDSDHCLGQGALPRCLRMWLGDMAYRDSSSFFVRNMSAQLQAWWIICAWGHEGPFNHVWVTVLLNTQRGDVCHGDKTEKKHHLSWVSPRWLL